MIATAGALAIIFGGCAESNYNAGYNSYDNRSYNDKQVDGAIASEMNSLSNKDIAELNTLK